jgi:WhiB family redox-sensing transcriptional regulator
LATLIGSRQGVKYCPMTLFLSPAAESRDEWVAKARCRSSDPEELFVRGALQRKAAVICRECPVITECGAEALDNRVEFGIWGGMTERQRRSLLQRHGEVVSWAEFLAAQRKHRNARDWPSTLRPVRAAAEQSDLA